MKQSLLIFTVLFFVACDPPNDMYQTGTVQITAQVINPRTNINLGDSVAFYFEVPDTVQLNGTKIKVSAGNNDGGTNGFAPCKIIQSSAGGFSNSSSLNTCLVYAKKGTYTSNQAFTLQNENGKLRGLFYMIPQQKGVYFFWQQQQGFIDLNNQSLRLRFNYNFGNINRNHQMLIDSAGASNNFGLFLQDKINQGLEVYGFKVN
jgi:hypothetical protein